MEKKISDSKKKSVRGKEERFITVNFGEKGETFATTAGNMATGVSTTETSQPHARGGARWKCFKEKVVRTTD